jgi:hypothetical protein
VLNAEMDHHLAHRIHDGDGFWGGGSSVSF